MEPQWLLWMVVAYFCGSIPFSLNIGFMHGVDIRTAGSGNVGATNCGRVLGRKWGVLCFVLDVLKGLIPVAMAGQAMGVLGQPDPGQSAWPWLGVAAMAVVGHIFPVWLKFKGGKGVATGLGVLLAMYPTLTFGGLIAAVVWVALLAATRYISVASMAAALTLPVYIALRIALSDSTLDDQLAFLVVTAALALLVVVRHRSNIGRLLAGNENKVGAKKTAGG